MRLTIDDVARIYLASHVLLNEEGQPFQEILNELTPEERPRYEHYLQMRGYDRLAPKDAAAARLMLLEIVDRATEELEDKAGVFRELEEINLQYAGHRLSWDDTPEGERLRRYELTCKRARSRMFDLLLKIRSTADELDIATVASIRRSVPTVTTDAIDQWGQFVADDITLPDEPAAGARSADRRARSADRSQFGSRKCAERTQFCMFRRPVTEHRDGAKEFRIDTPHVERKARRNRHNRQRDEPSRDRAGAGGPEVDAHEPVADLWRAVKAVDRAGMPMGRVGTAHRAGPVPRARFIPHPFSVGRGPGSHPD